MYGLGQVKNLEKGMKRMEPLSLVAIAVVASLAAGFGAGWGLKPDQSVDLIEAQTASIDALAEGNQRLVGEVQRVAVEEAQRETMISDKLTDVPPMCIPELGGDPMSPICAWAWCVRTGETDAQRCEQSKLADLIVDVYRDRACPDEQ